jgi:hypothetical protein
MDLKYEKDIENLIENKIQEDTNLDYKTPDFSKGDFNKELAKDVSAMANSDGGTIIYGIQEENHFPKEIIWIKKDEGYCEKIEQIINSKIFRKIEGIKVRKISSEDKTKFVIVVDIPKSDAAPHQIHEDSTQRRYYKRHGSITEQMEHYEIEDLFFKRKRPTLKIGLRNISKERDKPAFEIYLENTGKVVAEQTYIKLKTPSEWEINGWLKIEDAYGYPSYECILREDLVYPELKQVIGIVYHPKKLDLGLLKLNFLIVCRDMEILEGEIFISCEGNLKVNYEAPKTPPFSQQMHEYIFSKECLQQPI